VSGRSRVVPTQVEEALPQGVPAPALPQRLALQTLHAPQSPSLQQLPSTQVVPHLRQPERQSLVEQRLFTQAKPLQSPSPQQLPSTQVVPHSLRPRLWQVTQDPLLQSIPWPHPGPSATLAQVPPLQVLHAGQPTAPLVQQVLSGTQVAPQSL
jgi:hypothetical protein